MSRKLLVSVLGVAMIVFGSARAQAATITYNLSFVFSGNVPDSTSPYGSLTINTGTDCSPDCATNEAEAVFRTSLEDADEFFTEWDFNTDVFTLSLATDTSAGNLNSGTYNLPTLNPVSSNAYQADGDGNYDISIVFDQPNAGRFNGTNEVYDLDLIAPAGTVLTLANFDLLSAAGGGAGGPYHTAAHVQGITGGCSGWVADLNADTNGNSGPCTTPVPEPATLTLFGFGLVSTAMARRRIKRNQ